jgi:hypothetical protein
MFLDEGSSSGKSVTNSVADNYQPIRIDCRAIASEELAKCQRNKPHLCQHALCFENTYVCMHPLRMEIIERTRREAA